MNITSPYKLSIAFWSYFDLPSQLMLSNQMQQTEQNMSMQQSMFHQQMQMQLAAIDKRAETTEKYLCQIAKSLVRNKKRKKGGSDDEDDTSDDD